MYIKPWTERKLNYALENPIKAVMEAEIRDLRAYANESVRLISESQAIIAALMNESRTLRMTSKNTSNKVIVLLNHIEDVVDDNTWNKIDSTLWNSVSSSTEKEHNFDPDQSYLDHLDSISIVGATYDKDAK